MKRSIKILLLTITVLLIIAGAAAFIYHWQLSKYRTDITARETQELAQMIDEWEMFANPKTDGTVEPFTPKYKKGSLYQFSHIIVLGEKQISKTERHYYIARTLGWVNAGKNGKARAENGDYKEEVSLDRYSCETIVINEENGKENIIVTKKLYDDSDSRLKYSEFPWVIEQYVKHKHLTIDMRKCRRHDEKALVEKIKDTQKKTE